MHAASASMHRSPLRPIYSFIQRWHSVIYTQETVCIHCRLLRNCIKLP